MALVLKDRVKQAAAAPGTGTITLGATATGFQSFAAVGNGNTTYFAIVDAVSGSWEVNYGVYTSSGTTLSRNATPLSSSAGGALVNFTNAVDVFLTYPSEKAVWQDVSGIVAQQSFGAITATSAALTTGTITTAPVNNTDIVNKQYADAIASGIHFHEAVNLATTAALPANTYNNGTSGVGATLTGNANGALSVDSTLTTASERILVKNEAAGANNGVYTVTQVGSAGTPYILTRATDFDSVGTGVNEIDEGDFFLVTSGTANVNTAWVQQTPPPITIGTTALVFQQFSAPITYTAGTGLSESPTYTFNIANTGTAGTYGSSSFVPVFVTNAQGQVTSVTNTAIAINGSAVSGNISGSAGSVANALTLGTYLTGGTYNGSGAVTATVDAASANTASKVVARDASGNFSAGTITAALSGNATSATNLAGGAANQIAYQSGSGTTTFATAPTTSSTYLYWNGSAFAWGAITSGTVTSITAGAYLTGGTITTSGTIAVDATDANTASKVVARDASGNFSASTITAALNGNALTATTATTSGSTTGNAATATALQTARNIGGVSFNGTANIDLPGVNISGNQNTSGNAATATALSSGQTNWVGTGVINNVVGMLAWKNYGNSHVIFDASAGTSPSGGAVNSTNSAVAWTAGYPTLMGWNGGTTYGVRVDSARISDSTSGSAGSVDFANLTNKASGTGTYTTSGDYRAPIFYDSNDTTYYGDFASSSRMNEIVMTTAQFSPSGVFLRQSTTSGNRNLQIQGTAGGDVGIYALASNSGFGFQIYGDGGSNYGFLSSLWGAWDLRKTNGGNLYLNNQSSYYVGTDTTYMLRVYGTADIRSPVFYDLDNTGYYLDLNNTSEINKVYYNSNMTSRNYGIGQVGLYDSTKYQAVFSMGEAYILPANGGGVGTLYGIAWSHPNAGGAAANLASHGFLILENGTFKGAWGGASIRNPGDIRGTIYYDYDDTGYYLNPNSSSYLYSLSLSGAVYFQPNTWIQQNGSYGMYWPNTNGAHIEGNTLGGYGSIAIRGSRNGYGGIYDYYSGVNLGMYDSAGNGGVYREANGRWIFYHLISNDCTGFGTSTTNAAYNIYCPKGIYSGGRVDGTIFYDTSNTAYYFDMNSGSNLATTVTGYMYFQSNRNTSSSDAPLQAFSTGGNGAIMSFHRGGVYAINMGLDSDNVFRIGGWSAANNLLQMDMSGNLTMLANVTAYSDERLKKDWSDLPEDFVERLARVKSGTYTRIDNEMRQIGVGAQSLQPLMEEAVYENADGTLSVAYGNAAMASSVELARYVTALEQRISQLEARI